VSAPAETILSRDQHSISRKRIAPNALKVLYRLIEAGHEAYLVGGAVRDLLLGREPKDFDVATSADPETVRSLFRNARLIGRRFKLVHVVFGREIIEVATFRAGAGAPDDDEPEVSGDRRTSEAGLLLRDNVYGTLMDDVWRRDFTVNALYYTPEDFTVHDYTGGITDLEAGVIRMIGDPEQRYREDPVRMLRAARFAGKLGFTIEPGTAAPIKPLGTLLTLAPPARLFDEVTKLFLGGFGARALDPLLEFDLFPRLFPFSAEHLDPVSIEVIRRALANTDRRIAQEKSVTPAFLYCALLWPVYRAECEDEPRGDPGQRVIGAQHQRTAIPRRFVSFITETWALQARLEAPRPAKVSQLQAHPRFRAAYDFLCVRAAAGDADTDMAVWWTEYQDLDTDPEAQAAMIDELPDPSERLPDDAPLPGTEGEGVDGGEPGPRKRRRRGGRRRKRS
jgi:poly(A) polymerase